MLTPQVRGLPAVPVTPPAKVGPSRRRVVFLQSAPRAPFGWAGIALAALWFATAAFAFVLGDRPQGYNGVLVALGWASVILGWRAFADRRKGLRSPVRSLAEGVAILGVGSVLLVARLAVVTGAIIAAVWLLAGAEWVVRALR